MLVYLSLSTLSRFLFQVRAIEAENARLRQYVEGLLLRIMECYPQILEHA
jgi:hypothetical protein